MRRTTFVLLVAAASALAGCSKTQQSQTQNEAPSKPAASALTNPSNFPEYPGSSIVRVVPVDNSTIVAAMRKSGRSNVPANYRGHEIVARTPASLVDLRAWVAKLRATPPSGFQVKQSQPNAWGNMQFVNDASGRGALFETQNDNRIVMLVVLDPKLLREKLGMALEAIDRLNAMPAPMRAAIDAQTQKQFGYTATQMLDQNSPIGALLGTVRAMGSSEQRAVVTFDATKVPG